MTTDERYRTKPEVVSFVMKQAGAKEAPPYDKLFDFSIIKKASATLQARGWQPGS